MKEKITIAKQESQNDAPYIIDEKFLSVELNEVEMKLYAEYQNELYEVQGNIYCQYIII